MLYTESEVSILDKATQVLNSCEYLSEAESVYDPSIVPIRENTRLGTNIVRVEDLVDYAISNGNIAFDSAITDICEANGINVSNIVFSVNEVSILNDIEIADTVNQLKECGASVYATPISSNDIYYQLTEAIVDIMTESYNTEYEDTADYLFEAFIMNDMRTVLSENAITDRISSMASSAKQSISNTASSIADKISAAKESARKVIAKKIAALNKKAVVMSKMAHHAAGQTKVAFKNSLNKIRQGVEFLKQKISS